MKKFTLGVFGLFILIGGMLGSGMGIAVAICLWMIGDGLVEIQRIKNRYKLTKEVE